MKRAEIARKSWLKRGTKPIPRRTRIRQRNPERHASTFKRTYHSKRRKRWIAAHPCLVCGALPSVNAHTRHPSSGAGYKGDACAIAPICLQHEREKHRHGEDTFNLKYREDLYGLTLAQHAARTETEWQQIEAAA